ncbi:MAG: glycine zipper 2TM domain-containing protein [Pseudomonadota bacterium]
MHRTVASTLAAALMFATGAAPAQDNRYAAPVQDRYAQADSAYYDYARVLRVDPVLQQSRTPVRVSSDNCYSEDGYYTDSRDDDRYYDDRYADRRYDDRRYDGRNGYYDRDGNYHENYGTETGRNVATVIGGIVGAALGSKVGGGSARYATAAVGSMVGGMAGREVYETAQRNKQQQTRRTRVTVCDPVREGYDDNRYSTSGTNSVAAYDVTYEYAGREYVTRTTYHPGDRIRVRVDVRPE